MSAGRTSTSSSDGKRANSASDRRLRWRGSSLPWRRAARAADGNPRPREAITDLPVSRTALGLSTYPRDDRSGGVTGLDPSSPRAEPRTPVVRNRRGEAALNATPQPACTFATSSALSQRCNPPAKSVERAQDRLGEVQVGRGVAPPGPLAIAIAQTCPHSAGLGLAVPGSATGPQARTRTRAPGGVRPSVRGGRPACAELREHGRGNDGGHSTISSMTSKLRRQGGCG